MKKPKLVPEWKRLWRSFSMQAMGFGTAALAAWPLLPDDLRATVNPKYFMWGVGALLVAGMFGRAISQDGLRE